MNVDSKIPEETLYQAIEQHKENLKNLSPGERQAVMTALDTLKSGGVVDNLQAIKTAKEKLGSSSGVPHHSTFAEKCKKFAEKCKKGWQNFSQGRISSKQILNKFSEVEKEVKSLKEEIRLKEKSLEQMKTWQSPETGAAAEKIEEHYREMADFFYGLPLDKANAKGLLQAKIEELEQKKGDGAIQESEAKILHLLFDDVEKMVGAPDGAARKISEQEIQQHPSLQFAQQGSLEFLKNVLNKLNETDIKEIKESSSKPYDDFRASLNQAKARFSGGNPEDIQKEINRLQGKLNLYTPQKEI